jgi:hypothetical protein
MIVRSFSPEDQKAFARLSGDYNPMHMDAVTARRLLFGEPVVHGAHLLLWALEEWIKQRSTLVAFFRLQAIFHQPVKLEDPVTWKIIKTDGNTTVLSIQRGDTICTRVKLSLIEPYPGSVVAVEDGFAPELISRDLDADTVSKDAGEISLRVPRMDFRNRFPNLDRFLPISQLAVILASTRLVGMICPGLHSLFSELDLRFEPTQTELQTLMHYRVVAYDHRFDLADLQINGSGMSGRLKAFLRPKPQNQASFEGLNSCIQPDEFEGERALVVGGSRGLGELTAKLLAAGGAEVILTYRSGAQDAMRVVSEVQAGGGRAEAFQLDVKEGIAAEFDGNPTHLYFFATPHISVGAPGRFRSEIFNRFCEVYVNGLADVITLLVRRSSNLKWIFYPSSIFVDQVPPNLPEYAAAKAASELLCRYFSIVCPHLRIHAPRLPRLATDQSAALGGDAGGNPLPVLLSELRLFHAINPILHQL